MKKQKKTLQQKINYRKYHQPNRFIYSFLKRLVIDKILAPKYNIHYEIIDDINKENNGNLYVLNNETEQFELIEQPLDDYFVHQGSYTDEYADENNPITLSDDEIFVMGDNRIGNHSNDSRKIGPINYSAIQGKAVAIEGKCEITVENGVYKPINIRKHWPRFL